MILLLGSSVTAEEGLEAPGGRVGCSRRCSCSASAPRPWPWASPARPCGPVSAPTSAGSASAGSDRSTTAAAAGAGVLSAGEATTVLWTVVVVVIVSIVIHGVTGALLTRRLLGEEAGARVRAGARGRRAPLAALVGGEATARAGPLASPRQRSAYDERSSSSLAEGVGAAVPVARLSRASSSASENGSSRSNSSSAGARRTASISSCRYRSARWPPGSACR